MNVFVLRNLVVLLMLIVIVAIIAVTSGVAQPNSANAPKSTACAAPEYHQFDFFLGDWDAFDVDKPNSVVARTRIDAILDGCVVLEDYQGSDGHNGQSFSLYDATTKTWHQSWVTNRGELLLLDGRFENGEMVLSGHDIHNGKPREVRGTWRAVEGGVRETAVISLDQGKTWSPWFDLIFRPHTAGRK